MTVYQLYEVAGADNEFTFIKNGCDGKVFSITCTLKCAFKFFGKAEIVAIDGREVSLAGDCKDEWNPTVKFSDYIYIDESRNKYDVIVDTKTIEGVDADKADELYGNRELISIGTAAFLGREIK